MQIKGNKIKKRPPKTELEEKLNKEYMPYIRLHGLIPDNIVRGYLLNLDLMK